jgi:ABC-type transport system involved in cytochrome bd biosynthesis fused ATPase/permease subunit
MKEQIAVSQNIELKKKSGILGWLNWQNMVIALLFIVIILLIAIIIIFIKRSRNKNYISK